MKYSKKEKVGAIKDVAWPKLHAFLAAIPYVLALTIPGVVTFVICLWLGMPPDEAFGISIGVYIGLFFVLGALAITAGTVDKFLNAVTEQLLQTRAKEGLYRVYIEHAPGYEGPDGWEDGPGEYVWAREVGTFSYVLEEEPESRDYSIGDTVIASGATRTVHMVEPRD